jgi:acyl transferase domain-containing protein
MGRALYEAEPVFRAELDACAAVLAPLLGGDLIATLYPAPGADAGATARLAETAWTQGALVSVGLALAALWRAWGLAPTAVVGHSVGEITAAAVAGVLSRAAAVTLAAQRGQLMAAAPAGGLLAVAADAATVTAQLGADAWLAAINSPRQCVVAGGEAALTRVAAALAAQGVATQRLGAVGAFHSGLMAGVADPLGAAAAALPHAAPAVPWVSTLTGARGPTLAPAYWAQQVTAPVQWAAAVATLRATWPGAAWLELGPGHTLTHLVRAGAPGDEVAVAPLDDPDAARGVATALATLWTAGLAPAWRAAHAGTRRCIVDLPPYPFQRQRYWLEPADSSDESLRAIEKISDRSEWFYTPVWIRTPLDAAGERAVGRAVVFVDRHGIGDCVIDRLRDSGFETVRVESGHTFSRRAHDDYVLNPEHATDYRTLIAALQTSGPLPTHLLDCWTIADADGRSAVPSIAPEAAPLHVLRVVQALHAQGTDRVRLLLATTTAQDVTGEEPIRLGSSGLVSLARVIGQEHPTITSGVVDLAPDAFRQTERAAKQLHAELMSDAPDTAVAYRGAHRWVEHFVPRALAPASTLPRLLRDGGVYLITGGLGRIGLALAAYLARTANAKLLLVGRSPAPDPSSATANGGNVSVEQRHREAQRQHIEALGGEVTTLMADASEPAEMRATIEVAEQRYGRLDGVIQATGVTAGPTFQPLVDLDAAHFRDQFKSKADAAIALAEALGDRRLDFCVLMSSLSTVLGGLGFGAYAAANGFLDAFAAAQGRQGATPWISIAWDGWTFDEAAASGAAARMAMTVEEGVEAFARVMDAAPAARVVVSTASLAARRERWTAPAGPAASTGAAARHARHASDEYVAPRNETEQALSAIWEELIGLDRVGVHDDFFTLGGHSLLGTRVMARVRDVFDVDLSLTALFANPDIARLSARIEQRRAERSPSADSVARLMQQIKAMSPEEKQRLLSRAQQEGAAAR